MGGKSKEPSFGEGLVEGLREAVAWKRGEVVLDEAPYPPRTFIESTASPINTEVTSQKRTPSLKDA
ncbi:MAG: hypothetical protein ACKPB8_00655 [Alphaproteobacteria bacterium]